MTSEGYQTDNQSGAADFWARLGWLDTDRLLVIILFLGLFTMAVRVPTDTDTWWHLSSGRYIVENRAIPFQDPFSHTIPGKPWIDCYWLAQIGLYLVYRWATYPGLSLALAAVVVLTFWLVYRQCEGNIYVRAFSLVLAALTSALFWIARPHVLSFLLSSVFLYILYLYKRRGVNRLYVLPILFILWVNIHGGFIIGFILVGVYIIGEVTNNVVGLGVAPILRSRQILALVATSGISVAAVLFNPNTYKMLTYPFTTIGIGALQDYIQEWSSPDFHQLYQQPFLWMLLILLGAMALSRFRVDFTDLFLVGLFGYMSLLAVRNIALFALVAAPVLARHSDSTLEQLLDAFRRRTPWGHLIDKLLTQQFSKGPLMVVVNWTLLLLVVLAALVTATRPLLPAYAAQELEESLPVDAVTFIEDNKLPRELFNSYNWGGYLIWRLHPHYPVFIDGRTDLYDDAFIRRYLRVALARDDWQDTLDEYGINVILIERDSDLTNLLRYVSEWVPVYADDLAVVFVRNTMENQPLIETHRIELAQGD